MSCINTSGCAAPWNLTDPNQGEGAILEEDADNLVEGAKMTTTQTYGNGLIQIYPNPASQELNLDYSEQMADVHTIALFNLNGQKVLGVEISDTGYSRVDVSALPTGLYFLKINGTLALKVALVRK